MSDNLEYKIINGIKCYSAAYAENYTDYPISGADLTEQISESSFWVRSRIRLFKYIVERHIKKTCKTKILEIGCNTGDFIESLTLQGNSFSEYIEITGSEIYLKGLLYAKKKLPSINFIQFDVTQGKIDEKFHVIAAFDVIEHIENDITALSNISGMLHDNGVLIISVPQYMFLWSNLDEMVKHKRRYSRQELVEKLRLNGFQIDYITSFVFILFPLMLLSRLFDKRTNPSELREEDFKKRVEFSSPLNKILGFCMRIDEYLIRLGISLPFGGTLVVIAIKAQ